MRDLVLVAASFLVLGATSSAAFAAGEGVLVRVEAEKWSAQGGGPVRVLDRPEASGHQTVSYWEDPGVWLELAFDLPEADDYLISVRYALAWPDTRRQVILDGHDLGQVTLQTTGAWDAFTTASLALAPISLTAGRHVLRLLNADSRGLSLDWVALHTPDVFMADRRLSEDEYARLMQDLQAKTAGTRRRTLELGSVHVTFGDAGVAPLAHIGDCVLAAEGDGSSIAPAIRLYTTNRHHVAVVRSGVWPDRNLSVWITDGKNLYLVALADQQRAVRVPAPVVSTPRTKIVTARTAEGAELNFAARSWLPKATTHLTAGRLHITAQPQLHVAPWRDRQRGIPDLRLGMRQWAAGWIGAARFSPRWGHDQPGVSLTCDSAHCTVRETATRYPTLAAFYGEGLFDLTVTHQGQITFRDLSSAQQLSFHALTALPRPR